MLDEELAYFLGLITARGRIETKEDMISIILEIPFKKNNTEIMHEFLVSVLLKIRTIFEKLIGTSSRIFYSDESHLFMIKASIDKNSLMDKFLKYAFKEATEHKTFEVPKIIFETDDIEIKKAYLKGYGDIGANVRKSNRDQSGFHRVFVDVLNENWKLPVQLCKLFRDINVGVANIIWGHPNFNRAFKEHQIRIYTQEYEKIGFSIEPKMKTLNVLSKENKGKIKSKSKRKFMCKPSTRNKEKDQKPIEENNPYLPDSIRGKHFDYYWEICAEFGCEIAQEKLKELR